MEEIKRAYAWQEAVELASDLIRICEEFSDAERNVLVGHLRQAVIDVPAGIAADLKAGRAANLEAVIKLGAELELVHKIYPAIDTGDAPELLVRLMARMESDGFSEYEPDPNVEYGEDEDETVDVEQVTPTGSDARASTVVIPQVDGVGTQGTTVSIADPRQPRGQ